VVIAVTKKGVATLKQGRRRRVRFLASYLAGLSVSELELVAQALRAIQGALRPQ
jgi:DNA-binding MarR family transcriptional regulator